MKAERAFHGENLSYCLQVFKVLLSGGRGGGGGGGGGGRELLCSLYNPKVNCEFKKRKRVRNSHCCPFLG